jgi:hypothetical protein
MTELQFFISNQPSIPPTEWEKLELQLAWDRDEPSASLTTKQFSFEGAAAKTVNTWISSGTNSGPGIMEGLDFRISTCTNITALQGCLDTAAAEADYRCDKVVLPIRDNRIRDFITDRADGFSFSTLAALPNNAPGKISNSDYRLVPYCISSIPDYGQILSTSLAIFTITKEIAELIRKTGDLVAEAAVPPVTLVAAVKVILQAVYLLVMIAALITLVQAFIDNIIQAKKYKKGMYVRTLFIKACQYLGLTFSSTILNSSASLYYMAAIIPRKIVQPHPTNPLSFSRPADESQPGNSYGYYDGTFGQLIREMEDIFNAKARLRGTVLYFEKQDYWNNQSSHTLPDLDLYGKNNGSYKYNAHELAANYLSIWQVDNQELNTYNDYEGTSCQMQAKPNVISNSKNILLQGLVEKRFAYALGKRKTKLTGPEKAIEAIIIAMAFFTGLPLPASRIGWLLLSNDFTGVQKFVILDSSDNISLQNKTHTSATFLMNNYHSTSFPLSNQWLIYEGWEIPFCCEDYITLLNNNVIKTFDGRLGKVTNLRWQMGSDVAVIDFKVRPSGGRYTNNISQTIITDLAA